MELSIGHNFFNEKFKDYLRNFYIYGYIPESEFPASARTYHNDALRFEQIGFIPLTGESPDPRWRMEKKTKCLQMVTEDSRLLRRNPVHVFYTLCEAKETDALFFLSVLLRAAERRKQDEELVIDDVMACTDPKWAAQWQQLEQKGDAAKKKQFRDKTQAVTRRRMQQEFGATGLLNVESRGNNNMWTLPELTLEELLRHMPQDQRHGFLTGIDFFMKLGPFGEIGEMILSRLPEDQRSLIEKDSVCMDQFYLSKTLNDYNSADLLQAIRAGDWVIITYWQPQRKISGYVLCKPLNLRTGMANGREYVGYYDPIRRRAGYLRLEYIQSVELLDQRYVAWLIAAAWDVPCYGAFQGSKEPRLCRPAAFSREKDGSVKLVQYVGSGQRAQAVLCHWDEDGRKCQLPGQMLLDSRLSDDTVLSEDIRLAEALLERSWGGSVPYENQKQTLRDLKAHTLTMTLYVWKGEEYIRRRLWREARFGTCQDLDEHHIRFTVSVLDPGEMIPWITSFCGRICDVTCTDPDFDSGLRQHLRRLYKTVTEAPPEGLPDLLPTRRKGSWYRIPNLVRDSTNEIYQGQLRNPSPLCQKKGTDRSLLFTPLYSRTYRNCFDAFDRLASHPPGSELWRHFPSGSEEVGVLDQKGLENLTTLSKQGSTARFEQLLPQLGGICRSAAELRDVTPLMMKLVPLTSMEQRWLLSVLQEPLMSYFIGGQSADTLTTILKTASLRQPLFRREISAFDQYRHQAHEQPGSRKHFHMLRTAIKTDRSLHLTYRGKRRVLEMDFRPVRIVYAIRDDVFRIEGLDLGTGKSMLLRLDMIMDAKMLPGQQKWTQLPDSPAMDEYVLVFPNEKNLADRILTQFAPLQKRCVRAEDGTYELRFYAQEDTWRDILTQIMSFGSRVKLKKPDRVVLELQQRLRRQKNMWM